MDIITYALIKKQLASAVSGISSISVNGTNLDIITNDGDILTLTFPTPIKGTDYWTDEDKKEITNDVLNMLPLWEGGNY